MDLSTVSIVVGCIQKVQVYSLTFAELEELYHCAVCLHLHLYSFFSPEPRLERRDDLVALYYAATTYLDRVFKLQQANKLPYVPYYVMQMALAGGFALLKLLNSDFAGRLPSKGRQYVLQTVEALRRAKVWPNDLLDRFAEVLAQLWKESSRGRSLHSMSQSPSVSNSGIANMFNTHPTPTQQATTQQQRRESTGMLEDPLGLIVRSRMSMSVMFDCVWRWREAQVHGAADHRRHQPDQPGLVIQLHAPSRPRRREPRPHHAELQSPLKHPQHAAGPPAGPRERE